MYLPADIRDDLRDLSRRLGRPQAELIREAIAGLLASHPPTRPRFIGCVADAGFDAADDEAILAREWGTR